MTEEIKEILDFFTKFKDKWYSCEYILKPKQCILLLDYITNLQQDLDKANDIIEKDRQFYKCRMDEYVELKKENERLKKDNLLIKSANKLVSDNLHIYKSRCGKAIKDIDLIMTGNYEVCGTIYMQSSCCNKRLEIIKKDLIGSDE